MANSGKTNSGKTKGNAMRGKKNLGPTTWAEAHAEPAAGQIARPDKYTDEIGAEICDQLSQGKLLGQVLRAPGMPGTSTVFRWLEKYEAFRRSYARARLLQADEFAAETLRIASEELPGQSRERKTIRSGDEVIESEKITEADAVIRARLIVDTRKWILGKMHPERYGDQVKQDNPETGITEMFRALRSGPPRRGTQDPTPVPEEDGEALDASE